MASQKLDKKEPEKNLLVSKKKNAGRNKSGRITVRHRGGGAKRLYRKVDFGQEKQGQKAKVVALEYDPNRTSFLALLEYEDGTKRYRIAPREISKGDEIICQENAEIKPGNRVKLRNVPVGTTVFNISLKPEGKGEIVRSAGGAGKVLAHEEKYTNLAMPSTEVRKILSECYATIGTVSNPEKRYQKIKKAGRIRLKGRRPTVRGSAMSPIAHPHGGGEGRAPIGLKYPKTPWGKPARGVKTRKKKWTDKLIIKRRKKKKNR